MDDHELYRLLPVTIRQLLDRTGMDTENLTELRLRIGKPCIIWYSGKEYYLHRSGKLIHSLSDSYIVTPEDVAATVDFISHYSLYAYEEEIRQGYLTVKGGHRIGLAGKVVMEAGRIKRIRNIAYLNIRIAHQKIGCGREVHRYLYDENGYKHTLIISPPGCGKTTMLRDLIRLSSDGTVYAPGVTVGLADERSELAACYQGVPQLEVGCRTDVLDGCPKACGMMLLLRSMTPRVIAVDEIGGMEDYKAIRYVLNAGCAIMATVHGISIEDIRTGTAYKQMIEEMIFERYVILSNRKGIGTVEQILDAKGHSVI